MQYLTRAAAKNGLQAMTDQQELVQDEQLLLCTIPQRLRPGFTGNSEA